MSEIKVLLIIIFSMMFIYNVSASNIKYKEIDINVPSGTTNNHYEVLLNVSYESSMQSDFSDINFTDSSSNDALDYWIEEKLDGYWAKIWVASPFNITTTNQTIKMWYQNQSVINDRSNISSTFIFGDDFSESSIDFTSKWQSGSEGSYTTSSGEMLMADVNDVGNMICTQEHFLNKTASFKWTTKGEATDSYVATTQTALSYGGGTYDQVRNWVGNYHRLSPGSTNVNLNSPNYTAIWRSTFKPKLDYMESNDTINISKSAIAIDNYNAQDFYFCAFSWVGTRTYMDWIFVRDQHTSEPVVYFGSEQSAEISPFNVSLISDNSTISYPHKNENVEHVAYWSSNVSLSTYIFSWNNSGSWVNETPSVISGTSGWSNITRTVTQNKGNSVGWIIYANNSEGVWKSTGTNIYIIKNIATSIILSPIFNQSVISQNNHILALLNISDGDGLADIDTVIATIFNPSTYIGTTNSTPLNMSYYENQILRNYPTTSQVEVSPIYTPGVIHMWFREYTESAGDKHAVYSNSTNGINFTDPLNVTVDGSVLSMGLFEVEGPYNVSGYPDNSLFTFMPNYPGAATEADQDIIVFNFTLDDPLNWDYACGGSEITTGGYKKNPSVIYNQSSGLWEALFEQGTGTFTTWYWNSSSLCSGWTKYSQQFGHNAGNANIHRVNGQNIVFYGDMLEGTSNVKTSVAIGDLNSLQIIHLNLLNPTDAGFGGTFASDPGVVIIEDNNPNFYAPWMIYFAVVPTGDDSRAAMAYDYLNRTFNETFFSEVSGFYENITLTQEGATSTWSGAYTNTSTIGIYNLTGIWVDDGDDITYESYSNISFEVQSSSDTIYPNWITIPNNQSITYPEDFSGVNFVANDTSFGGYYVNDTRFSINSSGFLDNNTGLGYGVYSILVTANDTSNNKNNTVFRLEVNKSDDVCNVLFNETSPLYNGTQFTVYTDCTTGFQIYRNGTVVANNSVQYPLNASAYNFTVIRNDTINYTNFYDEAEFILSSSIDTTPPSITVQSPTSTTYTTNTIYFNATADEAVDTWIINYAGTNITTSMNTSMTISEGTYNLKIYANDTYGNWGLNDSITFTVDIPSSGGGGGGGTVIEEIEEVGDTNETFSTIYLESIEILNSKICKDDGKLRFVTMDKDDEFTLLTSAIIYKNEEKLSNKLFLDLTNEEYYYNLDDLEEGIVNITIIGEQNGKTVNVTKELEIKTCVEIGEVIGTKLGDLLVFVQANIIVVLLFLSVMLFSYLTYRFS